MVKAPVAYPFANLEISQKLPFRNSRINERVDVRFNFLRSLSLELFHRPFSPVLRSVVSPGRVSVQPPAVRHNPILTKSDFLKFKACSKSLWLLKNKPGAIEWPVPTAFDRLLMLGGYAVEAEARRLVAMWSDEPACTFQRVFQTDDGLFARADLVKELDDGAIDLWEIKSSTSIETSDADHVVDAGFQTIVAERSGVPVRSIGIIHVNGEYVRSGEVDPAGLLVVEDVTAEVRERMVDLEADVGGALGLLGQTEIDEAGCDCLMKSKRQHCPSFAYFNPGVPSPSIYDLPRLSAKQRSIMVPEGRFALDTITAEEATPAQRLVLAAMQSSVPVVNREGIRTFIDALEFPLYFYDYETFGSAIPIAEGHRPHEQMPVQVSLHRLDADDTLTHSEILTDQPGAQAEIVAFIRSEIGKRGNLISWNATFENSCNKRLARLVPEQAEFLAQLNQRTCDLMDVFKADYVHPGFGGSTSIKKILPVVVPGLEYDQNGVHDGGGAMEAWHALIISNDPSERAKLRASLLAYCQLDTLAMVEILRTLRALAKSG